MNEEPCKWMFQIKLINNNNSNNNNNNNNKNNNNVKRGTEALKA